SGTLGRARAASNRSITIRRTAGAPSIATRARSRSTTAPAAPEPVRATPTRDAGTRAAGAGAAGPRQALATPVAVVGEPAAAARRPALVTPAVAGSVEAVAPAEVQADSNAAGTRVPAVSAASPAWARPARAATAAVAVAAEAAAVGSL